MTHTLWTQISRVAETTLTISSDTLYILLQTNGAALSRLCSFSMVKDYSRTFDGEDFRLGTSSSQIFRVVGKVVEKLHFQIELQDLEGRGGRHG